MKKKKSITDLGKEVESCMELKPNPQILIFQNKSLAHKCDGLKKEIENLSRDKENLEKSKDYLNLLVNRIIESLSEVAGLSNELNGSDPDLKVQETSKFFLTSNGTSGTEETGAPMDESKENGPQDVPEPIRTQARAVSYLLEVVEKASKPKLANGKPTGPWDNSLPKKHPPDLNSKLLKATLDLESAKTSLKKAEDENREKSKTVEELEKEVEKLGRRLQTSPMTPYALTLIHHFSKSAVSHECMCIVCGETMRAHAASSSGESPDPHTPDNILVRTQSVHASHSLAEIPGKLETVEEELQRLAAENIELKKDIIAKENKEELTEDMVLNSHTFRALLSQAELMAKDYAELKRKYSVSKKRQEELCTKYETDIKNIMSQEAANLQQIIDEVTKSCVQSTDKGAETAEQKEMLNEAEKYYKNIVELQKRQIAGLESDLVQANKQLEALKKERKRPSPPEEAKVKPDTRAGEKDSERVEKLTQLLQLRTQELASERQMGEMWISELEVTSKAYDQEKSTTKQLAQELEKLNERLAKLMMDSCKENKQKLQCEGELSVARQKIALLEKEVREQTTYRSGLEEQKKKTEEVEKMLRAGVDEWTKVVKEQKTVCQKSLARTDDLRREAEHEKKLAEEWQLRCVKGSQKGTVEQVEIDESEMGSKDPETQIKTYKRVIETYRNMLRCNVCKTRNKDVVLARCCHLFCRDCITKYLQMRQRNCPTCRQKFTAEDIKQIWWDSQV